ncbi:MAG: hypothetical protein LBU64_09595 [Planctomycetota bacterium]|jgi:hypothetical protein|nr:hypothetical protein [Planctomycetota bacterium]
MLKYLEELARDKTKIAVFFSASAGNKLISANGVITEVGADFMVMTDIYGNIMLIPLAGIAYIEIKK